MWLPCSHNDTQEGSHFSSVMYTFKRSLYFPTKQRQELKLQLTTQLSLILGNIPSKVTLFCLFQVRKYSKFSAEEYKEKSE